MLEARRASQIDFAPDGTPIVVGNSNAGGLPLFSIIQVPLNSERLGFLSLAKDNGLLSGDVFVDAYNELVKLSLTGNEPSIVTMAEYEAEILAKGKCGKFGLSITNKQFKIPFIPGVFLQSKESSADVGIWTPDQMRSIYGKLPIRLSVDGSGPWTYTQDTEGFNKGTFVGGDTAASNIVVLDTTRLGINYSGAKTKPESISVDYQMKLYGTLTNKAQVDMADVVNQLASKLDTSTFENESWSRAKAWARIAASGDIISSKNITSVTVGNGVVTVYSPFFTSNAIVVAKTLGNLDSRACDVNIHTCANGSLHCSFNYFDTGGGIVARKEFMLVVF